MHFSTDLSLISEMLQILLYIIWIFIFLNFGEEFCWTFPSSINFLFLKSNSEIGTPTLDRHTYIIQCAHFWQSKKTKKL